MSRLMLQLLAARGYLNAAGEGGSDTAGTGTAATEPSAEVLAEHGLTMQEFKALDERDQQNLLADTPDDTQPSGEPAAQTAAKTEPEPKIEEKTPPAAAAKEPPKTDEGADPEEEPAATPPATTTAETTPPAAAAPVVENAWDDMPDAAIVLPKIPEPPKWVAMATADVIKQRDDAQAAIDDLEQKYENGDITLDELRAQREPHRKTVSTLSVKILADEVNAANTQAAIAQRFDTYVATAMEQAKAAGLDFTAPENEAKLKELDAAVRRFAQAAPLMFPGKTGDWYDRWALNQAYTETAGKYGVTLGKVAPPAAKPATTQQQQQQQGRRAAPDLAQIPPTTRGAPAAADPGIAGNEFAHLESLSPADLEKAVARMTPEQRERYLDA